MSKNSFKNLFIVFLLLALIFSGPSFTLPVLAQNSHDTSFKVGEFLVKFKDDSEIYKFKVDDSLDILSVIESYKNLSEVENISPNYIVKMTAFPNDPKYGLQSYLNTINIKKTWSKELLVRERENITRQSVIAILDTGVDLNHPDLKDKIWNNEDEFLNSSDSDANGYTDDINGWDFVDNDSDPNPSFAGAYDEDAVKHGTIVASIAAASVNNSQGISGVSWFSKIMPLRVLDSSGSGDVFSVIQAIEYAIDNGADIINMSFVGDNRSDFFLSTIRKAYSSDVLIVAAAGNTDSKVNGVDMDITKSYPVCYDGNEFENMVIGVASVGPNLRKSNFSNYGECVDIVAPGENFYAATVYRSGVSGFENYYDGYWAGTSLSAPLVSGTLALIKSLRPGFSSSQIKNFVLENARNIDSYNPSFEGRLGGGLLDSLKALEAALGQKAPPERQGDGNNYIVAGLGLGSFPQIKVLKTDGSVFKAFYAYSPHFKGAVNVAVGDVDGDGLEDIVTGAGAGGGPHIRIFDIEGRVISQFFAFDKNFRGGVNIAVGDIDGDGIEEIITGAGRGINPEVKIFDFKGRLISQFLAYNENFKGGVKVAVGDIDGDGIGEVITGAGAGGGPHLRIFESDGRVVSQFFAYNKNFNGGINVAAADLHGDGQAEIIVSVESNSVPTVRVFNYSGKMLSNFFAYDPSFLKGIYVSAGDIDSDGVSEIITGPSIGGTSQVKVFNLFGNLKLDLLTHRQDYFGGVRPEILSQ